MPAQVYEGFVIFDSNRYGRDQVGVSSQIEKTVTKLGGEMLVSRLWEERRLAYPIKGQRKGTYWLSYFRLDSNQLTALNREFELNESILRSLVLKVDARIVDALVEHAKSTAERPQRTERREQRADTGEAAVSAV
ncbi:MAG: 30S ribosomal protein S6 [Pirellulales bacterium]|nr:30S ribosomal protein S6 [Pirellulales bacterium]